MLSYCFPLISTLNFGITIATLVRRSYDEVH